MVTRFLCALLFLCLPAMALASEAGVRCVQQQLAAAGQDPGRIDGIVGARTRHALAQHARARGLDRTRRITRDSATPWCRRLGIDDPALREFWPSALNRVIVTVAGSVDPVLARLIRTRMPAIHADVAERMGVVLAGTDRVIVGSGPVELRREILRAGFTDIGNLDAILIDHCEPGLPIGGFALPGLMVICLETGVRLRGGISYEHLSFVLAHEVTHLVQFQLTGLPPQGTSPERRVPMSMVRALVRCAALVEGMKARLNRPDQLSAARRLDRSCSARWRSGSVSIPPNASPTCSRARSRCPLSARTSPRAMRNRGTSGRRATRSSSSGSASAVRPIWRRITARAQSLCSC